MRFSLDEPMAQEVAQKLLDMWNEQAREAYDDLAKSKQECAAATGIQWHHGKPWTLSDARNVLAYKFTVKPWRQETARTIEVTEADLQKEIDDQIAYYKEDAANNRNFELQKRKAAAQGAAKY